MNIPRCFFFFFFFIVLSVNSQFVEIGEILKYATANEEKRVVPQDPVNHSNKIWLLSNIGETDRNCFLSEAGRL